MIYQFKAEIFKPANNNYIQFFLVSVNTDGWLPTHILNMIADANWQSTNAILFKDVPENVNIFCQFIISINTNSTGIKTVVEKFEILHIMPQ